MNHYRRYAIDHTARTAHLSIMEEGAYTRLLDWQYINEAPLPFTPAERYRITRATTLAERRVTDKIAETCFGADGWQQRARQEIERTRPSVEAPRTQGWTPPRVDLAELLRQSATAEGEVPRGVADLIRIPCAPAPVPRQETPPVEAPVPATEAAPTPPIATAPADHVSTFGMQLLTARQAEPGAARDFLVVLREAVGDNSAFELLRACEQQKIRDPIPWLSRAVEVRKMWEAR